MSETTPRNNAHCSIPDDPDQSTYRFIIVAAKRARQLQSGHRPVLPNALTYTPEECAQLPQTDGDCDGGSPARSREI